MSVSFFLVSHEEETAWPLVLGQALTSLGTLETVPEKDAVERIAQRQCDPVVIVDAAVVQDLELLISRLRLQCPKARVIVATASPTWRRAREAFQAGAMGYIRKLWDREAILIAVKDILSRPLPDSLD